MTGAERFMPYRRGISKQEIIDYLHASDTVPTLRENLPKRALQVEAADRQRRLQSAMRRSHLHLAANAPPPSLAQQAVAFSSLPQAPINHATHHGGINPALLQAAEDHGQPSDVVVSSGSGRSSSDQESSDQESSDQESSDQESSDRESSPDPFELTNRRQSTDQIEFGDEELIDLASHGSTVATLAVVDSTQQNMLMSLFEGVDVFAPASVSFDPPTPILDPDISSMTEGVANPQDHDPDVGERAQSSTTSQSQSQPQVVERLDKLINIQSQVLCVNMLTFGMLFQARSQEFDAPTIPVTEK